MNITSSRELYIKAGKNYRGLDGWDFRSFPDVTIGYIKAGVHMKALFWLVITALAQISRLRFKQSRISMLIPEIYVLGRFVNFLVIFRYIWR